MKVRNIYYEIRNEILSIPGHAVHFREKIIREQNEVRGLPFYTAGREDYDSNRHRYINEILRHLPSPETVGVLGEFLSDEKDVPPPPRRNQNWAPPPTNAKLAVESLSNIGLRNSPSPPHVSMYDPDPKYLILYRTWYEKVKAGTLPFSFIGQSVWENSPRGLSVRSQGCAPKKSRWAWRRFARMTAAVATVVAERGVEHETPGLDAGGNWRSHSCTSTTFMETRTFGHLNRLTPIGGTGSAVIDGQMNEFAPRTKYGINPDTGDVVDPQGEDAENIGEVKSK